MFRLKEYNTDAKTEILAGITTFLTMIYIVIVNPVILSSAGVPLIKYLQLLLFQQS